MKLTVKQLRVVLAEAMSDIQTMQSPGAPAPSASQPPEPMSNRTHVRLARGKMVSMLTLADEVLEHTEPLPAIHKKISVARAALRAALDDVNDLP